MMTAQSLPPELASRFRGQIRDIHLDVARITLDHKLRDPQAFELVANLRPEELDGLLARMARAADLEQAEGAGWEFDRWQDERAAIGNGRPPLEPLEQPTAEPRVLVGVGAEPGLDADGL
jgi:hypothetical protein